MAKVEESGSINANKSVLYLPVGSRLHHHRERSISLQKNVYGLSRSFDLAIKAARKT